MRPCCLAFAFLVALTCFPLSARARSPRQGTQETPKAAEKATPEEAPRKAAPPRKAPDKEVTVFEELVRKIRQGGWIVVVLMIFSVVGIGFALERAGNLRRKSIVPKGFADQAHALWEKGDIPGLTAYCDRDPSVLARMVRAIVDHRDCDVGRIQALAGDLGSREMRLHLQRAYPLAIIATLSPLLGLLGTVFGMIGAFDTVAAVGEMGDASILANDIAKALITTAAGLLVGIPALGLYHFFKSRTSSLAVLLEEEIGEIINAWFLRAPRPPAPAAAPAPEGKEGPAGAH